MVKCIHNFAILIKKRIKLRQQSVLGDKIENVLSVLKKTIQNFTTVLTQSSIKVKHNASEGYLYNMN